MISAIILAAGRGSRMESTSLKQLLPLGQSTILGQTIHNVLGSKAGEVIVVLGFGADSIKPLIPSGLVKTIVNQNYREGMSSSIIAGVKVASIHAQGYLLVLGDQPFIGSCNLDTLIETFNLTEPKIIIPIFDGKRGHPVLIPKKYREELLELKGDTGARSVVARHNEDVVEVEVDSSGILVDIDTPKDYLEWQK